ncbi:DNA-binding transcriptional regulator DsdC [Neptuniibacter sp. SY11_33]|uniref:DNA-binding transcriptional regulator DsdC n=1 Tax=Neptuniibacter sp. SY11_33 TaxID=3398215 RepID=UPI0039F48CF1
MANLKPSHLNNAVLANLQCFSSAAKHLSFTLAADELNLTQGAISQRIRKLEEQLGFALFLRYNRRLQLTAEGERLLIQTNNSLTELNNLIRDIHTQGLAGELSLSVPPSFASQWLLEKLADFSQLYPQIFIRMETHSRLIDFYAEQIDLAIYYGQGEYPGLVSWPLMDEQLIPVCTSDFAEKHDLWDRPEKLNDCHLLHDAQAWPEAGPYSEWSYWADQQALSLDLKQGHCFDKSEHAVNTAKSGLGVAIGRKQLIEKALNSGELINPLRELQPIQSQQGYFLVTHEDRKEQPIIRAFREWILEKIQAH